jgi:hypothetical protein
MKYIPGPVSSFIALIFISLAPNAAHADPIKLKGELIVEEVDDFKGGKSETRFFLKEKKSGKRKKLKLRDERSAGLAPGSEIEITGEVDAAGGDGSEIQVSNVEVTSPAVAAALTGAKNVLILNVSFADAAANCSNSELDSAWFNPVNDMNVTEFYKKNSDGQLSITGQIASVQLSTHLLTGTCDYNAWASAADAAARAAGIEPNNFSNINYTIPDSAPCNWSGLGEISGRHHWVSSCYSAYVHAHELGHNLGMQHATRASPFQEYGDASDVMGNQYTELNAPHRDQLGWVSPELIVTATASGTYRVSLLEYPQAQSTGPMMVKVWSEVAQAYYYFSYRRGYGNWDYGVLQGEFDSTLSVHRFQDFTFGSYKTAFIQGVVAGQSYSNLFDGIQVTNVRPDLDGVTFDLQVTPGCVRGVPTLSLAPTSQSGAAGSSLNYNYTIKNNDTAACGTSNMQLGESHSSGLTVTLPYSLSLAPGATGSVSVRVTSSATLGAGNYVFWLFGNSQNGRAGSLTASYVVTGSSVSSPYSGTATSIPGLIETENFDNGGEGIAYHDSDTVNQGNAYRTAGVDIQASTGGGYHIGYVAAGEWLKYTVNVATAGKYDIAFPVAATGTSGKFRVEIDGVDATGTISVPATGGWQTFKEIRRLAVNLTAGTHVLRLYVVSSGFNISSMRFTASVSTPYGGGAPILLPAQFQAENYDLGGQGKAYSDTDTSNRGAAYRTTEGVDLQACAEGGYNVAWTKPAEWINYSVRATRTGAHTLSIRYASIYNVSLHVEIDGVNVTGTIAGTTATGAWQTYSNVSVPVNLTIGDHVVKFVFDSGNVNLNWVDLR